MGQRHPAAARRQSRSHHDAAVDQHEFARSCARVFASCTKTINHRCAKERTERRSGRVSRPTSKREAAARGLVLETISNLDRAQKVRADGSYMIRRRVTLYLGRRVETSGSPGPPVYTLTAHGHPRGCRVLRSRDRRPLRAQATPSHDGQRRSRARPHAADVRLGVREAAHPPVGIVRLISLDDLQVLHLQLRDVVHGDLEGE